MRRMFLTSLILCLVSAGGLLAAVPQQINYQGYLTDTDGTPLDTTVDVTFRIYEDYSGGTPVWDEIHTVTAVNGYFECTLGGADPLTPELFDDETMWLGITVGSNSEMEPLTPFTAIPYAFRVGTVGGATGGTITGKVNMGLDNTNSGDYAFVVGRNNRANGAYSVVAGGGGVTAADSNSAGGNYSTISGGRRNTTNDNYATIGGGEGNSAPDSCATVGGGEYNTASGGGATVSGGTFNFVSGDYATVAGGYDNAASGRSATVGGGYSNEADNNYATVGGGYNNSATGYSATVGGGANNNATYYATVGGGFYNRATGYYSVVSGGGGGSLVDSNSASGDYSAIGGGHMNTASGSDATVGGGCYSGATGYAATVGGGQSNEAADNFATVSGGYSNTASNSGAVVGGGSENNASGGYATVPGGALNVAAGSFSFATGHRAKANHDGCFVWGDSYNGDVTSSAANQFRVRASGGTWIYSNTALNAGVTLAAGANAWVAISDSTKKHNIRLVDTKDVLDRVSQLPIKQWSYKSQDPSIEHIGPMAQDFYKLFHLGDDSLGISTIDPDGIALAAIQELNKKVQEIETLKAQNLALEKQVAEIRVQLQQLYGQGGNSIRQVSFTQATQ